MGTWPKNTPVLTDEQRRISDDWMRYWHEVSPRKFGIVERFNHDYVVRHTAPGFTTTLEIGAGLGEHFSREILTAEQRRNYFALDLRENMVDQMHRRFPEVKTLLGDAQAHLDFPDEFFDRIIAIHVLEHMTNLPACIAEMYRLCNKAHGQMLVVIPCEGGAAYTLARKISSERMFTKRYKQPYSWFISGEHVNRPREIVDAIQPLFKVKNVRFFPLPLFPLINANICIGFRLAPRKLPCC